jgi:DNA-binding transcriptional LysR family regulator
VELTDAGRALIPEARHALRAIDQARNAVLDVGTLLRGSLAIGGIPTPGTLDQPRLLAEFRRRYPAVDIRYTRDTSMRLVDALRHGTIDLALVSLPSKLPPGVDAIPLVTEALYFVCRPDHRLAGRSEVRLDDLADETFVGAVAGSVGHEALEQVFARAGVERRVPFEVNDVLAILDFVAEGLGVTLLQDTFAHSRPDVQAVPLAGAPLTWTLALAVPPAGRITTAARAFRDVAFETLGVEA